MHPWDDSPAQIHSDVKNLRDKQLKVIQPAPSTVTPAQSPGSNQGPGTQIALNVNSSPISTVGPDLVPNSTATVSGPAVTQQGPPKTAPTGPQSLTVETVKARVLLKQAKEALAVNDLAKAQSCLLQVKALNAKLEWYDGNPDQMLADVARRARLPGAPKVDLVAANQPIQSADPRMQTPAAPREDPRLLLRQGRELYHQNKLDEAEKLCARAASQPGSWGLFEDSPEKLRQDIQRVRSSQDHEESIKLTKEARKLFNEGKIQEAKALAYRARKLHGPYGFMDLGDRADRLITEIEVAEMKQRKEGNTAVVKNDKANPTANSAKAGPMSQETTTAGIQARTTARTLLVEARALEKQGQLTEAMRKATEAQRWAVEGAKGNARFGPGDDNPDQALQEYNLACKNRVNSLMRTAEESVTRSQDPGRFVKATEALTQARQLALAFRQDVVPIDQKFVWLRQTQFGKDSGPLAPSDAFVKVLPEIAPPPPTGIVPPPPPPSIALGTPTPNHLAQANAVPQKQGLELLDKARLELNAANTKNARTLAEEAFKEQYGVRSQAEALLRTIDSAEWEQKQLAMNRDFESGQLAYFSKNYKQAYATFLTLDERLLTPQHRTQLREMMGSREMEAEVKTAGSSGSRPLVQTGGQEPGKAISTDMQLAEKNLIVGPSSGKSSDGALAELGVMRNIEFQKLTADGLEAQRRAMASAKAHDFNTALEILRSYAVSLESSNLSADRIAVLKRPIERRSAEFKTLQATEELQAKINNPNLMNATENEKKRLEETNRKDNEIADIMKQYNKFYRDHKYREAWLLAMRGKDIDPDNLAIQAAIMQAGFGRRQGSEQENRGRLGKLLQRGQRQQSGASVEYAGSDDH